MMRGVKKILFHIVFLMIVFFASVIEAGVISHHELSLRSGYHFFSSSDSWAESWGRTLEEDLFFRNENFSPDNNKVYYSENVNTDVAGVRGLSVIELEYSFGLIINRFPFLDPPDASRGIRGFRVGVSLGYYPLSSGETDFYHGPIVYHNSKAVSPEPENLSYNGSITLKQDLFIIAATASLSYWFENVLAPLAGVGIVPFFGVEFGAAAISGMRKTMLRSENLFVETTGETRSIEADIHEGFFNGFSPRAGVFGGCRFSFGMLHAIDVRVGYIYQETTLTMTRTGTWSETINGAAYSRRVDDGSRSVVYSQTGLMITIGYSLRLK